VSVTGGSPQVTEARLAHRLGMAENNAGRPAKALPLLRRALELTGADPGQDELLARIWISIATSESELGGLSRGLQALAEAERFVERADVPELRAMLDNQRGFMLVRGGKVAEGLRQLDSAVELIDQVDAAMRYSILLNRGTTHLYRGNLRAARADLAGAVESARQQRHPTEEAKAQHNLGYLEFLAGNLASALQVMDQVLGLDADVSTAVILLDRARVLIEAGLHREADAALAEAAELFRSQGLFKDLGEVELARAECALLDGQIAAARRLAGSARTRFRRRGNDRWRRDAELLLLQSDLAAGRPGLRLAPVAVRLAAEYRAEALSTQARTAQLIAAEALLRAGRVAAAGEVAQAAGPIRGSDPISARIQTRVVRGKLHWANGDRRAAKREFRTGLDELARHQASFGSIDVQTAGAVHGRTLSDLYLTLALAEGRPREVLAAIELSRATSSRIQPVVAPENPAVADRLAELRRLTEELRMVSSDPASAALASAHRRRIAEIEHGLRTTSWHRLGSGLAERAASPEQIQAGLADAGATGVNYFETGDELSALVAGRSGLRLVPLGISGPVHEWIRRIRADLDMLARGTLPAATVGAVQRSLRSSLECLDQAILKPLVLDEQRLVLSPTGPLAVVPWNLLPSLRQRPVVVVPSGSAWLKATRPQSAGIADTVSAFAGPGLVHADAEAKSVAAIWGAGHPQLGERVHRSAVKAALAAARVVHLAAHGTHQPENPLFSSIRLADGPVFAYELDDTAGIAEHVVLSACELGQATFRPGDEALGLTSVLLHLGTRSVISGVAKLHDEVAAEVMPRYHRALAAGMESDLALAEACGSAGTLPAPFVCFGASWRTTRQGGALAPQPRQDRPGARFGARRPGP
jgi:tetratricopeptide (TPR) repeat protein